MNTTSQPAIAVSTTVLAAGIVVSTGLTAGAESSPGTGTALTVNHAEGIVVSTAIVAGADSGNGGLATNHAEGIVVSTALAAGASINGAGSNHSEGLVRR